MSDLLRRLQAALADRYDLDREVGRGGMATVYLAQDVRHHRSVAVKVLHPELALSLGSDRFLREIQIAARLQHPHIVPLYDSGQAGEFLYYVMPFVDGESLRQRLERERHLPLEEALKIARAVAAALDYAHRQQIVHRDIKPENVMLHEGEAMVTDFGIAKAVTAATATAAKSIAVLPFVNMSADRENEYFSDGIAEEIINALTKVQALRVASRTSAFAFKGRSEDIGDIGRKLKVATVLEGSVRKAGDRLRVTAQLVNVADGYHLWSERYDRQLEDMFAIQDEIAGNIVRELRVLQSDAEQRGIEKA